MLTSGQYDFSVVLMVPAVEMSSKLAQHASGEGSPGLEPPWPLSCPHAPLGLFSAPWPALSPPNLLTQSLSLQGQGPLGLSAPHSLPGQTCGRGALCYEQCPPSWAGRTQHQM